MSEKSDKTSKLSLTFTGLIYLLVGGLILLYPRLVYYWVSGGFLIHGITSLIRAWKN
ncbi:MAG: hypothetical protein ACOCQS_01235 [Bacillota bacterium]